MIYYHNPKCSKCCEGLKLLQSKNISFTVKEYLKEPLNIKELKEMISKLGLGPSEVVRKKEVLFKELKLDRKDLSQEEWFQTIVENPVLLQRPILVTSKKAVIGRPPERLLEVLD